LFADRIQEGDKPARSRPDVVDGGRESGHGNIDANDQSVIARGIVRGDAPRQTQLLTLNPAYRDLDNSCLTMRSLLSISRRRFT
jgi:hypothetical protein